jgi:hypothetical protein
MENKFELVNYAIAESAATQAEVDGHMACSVCCGCGLAPSSCTLTSTDRRQTHCDRKDWRFTPVKLGIDICKACDGSGESSRITRNS